jgi:hypothetical protein
MFFPACPRSAKRHFQKVKAKEEKKDEEDK